MERIKKIESEEMGSALAGNTRQYLAGKLKRPQVLNHIDDEKIEIGITSYYKYEYELPHTHTVAFEYQFVISGYTVYLDIDSEKEYVFRKGDFYRIEPGFKYAQKSKKGTKILFVKIPPGNDKIDIQPNEMINAWLSSKIETVRTDYTNDSNAPKANSLKPATAVAIFNEKNELLLLKRKDSKNWTMPGGTLDFGESLIDCAIRETKEETGLDVQIKDLIGTYSNPLTVIEYSDGEVRQEFTMVYYGTIISGSLKLDHESLDYKWEEINNIGNLAMAPSQRIRIDDVVDYMRSGKQHFR